MNLKQLFRTLNASFFSLNFFEVFVQAGVMMIVLAIIFYLLGVKPWLAILPTIAYFIVLWVKKSQSNPLLEVERAYPELHEKLRTVNDNMAPTSEIVLELQQDVLDQISSVEISTFYETEKNTKRIMVIMLLCIILLIISLFNVPKLNYEKIAETISESLPAIKSPGNRPPDDVFAGGASGFSDISVTEDIYGAQTFADLDEQQQEIKINSLGYDINIRDIKQAKPQNFEEGFPQEIFSENAEVSQDKIAKEHQDLVKNYFKKLWRKKNEKVQGRF